MYIDFDYKPIYIIITIFISTVLDEWKKERFITIEIILFIFSPIGERERENIRSRPSHIDQYIYEWMNEHDY